MPEVIMESLSEKDQFEVTLCGERSHHEGKGTVVAYEDTKEPSRDTRISVKLSDGKTVDVRIAACRNPNDVAKTLGIATGYFDAPEQKTDFKRRQLLERAFENDTLRLAKIAAAG